MTQPTVLLTGASGFVGRHAAVALGAAGFRVRALSRAAQLARRGAPDLQWCAGDLESNDGLAAALKGTDAAVYLYHAVGSDAEYAAREARVAEAFRIAAEAAGVKRIVYLGGVVPDNATSRHLESRRRTGEILRNGRTPVVELRASMIIGCGSASFTLIRDLAVHSPVLALPRWLDHESCPISVCDVAPAIALSCLVPIVASTWYDLPGPDCLSHRALLTRLTRPLGTTLVERRIDTITPTLATWGVAALSRVDAHLSRELVAGLTSDLRPTGPSFWPLIQMPALRPLQHAILDALSDEFAKERPGCETRRRIARKTVEWIELAGVRLHA